MAPAPSPGLVDNARTIATKAHAGQFDKAGIDYITHPARVAARVADRGPEYEAVAWLHDVIEDCSEKGYDEAYLREHGVPDDVVAGVLSVTKHDGEDHPDAVRRAARNPLGLAVKAADVADNSDPARLAKLDHALRDKLTEKYRHAREVLDAYGAPRFDHP